jgi:hypothetical protein
MDEVRAVKKKLERERDLDGIDTTNILQAAGVGQRRRAEENAPRGNRYLSGGGAGGSSGSDGEGEEDEEAGGSAGVKRRGEEEEGQGQGGSAPKVRRLVKRSELEGSEGEGAGKGLEDEDDEEEGGGSGSGGARKKTLLEDSDADDW